MKMCTDCIHFAWRKEDWGLPSLYEQGNPICTNGKAWAGVQRIIIGGPLPAHVGRIEGACGKDGVLWEAKAA